MKRVLLKVLAASLAFTALQAEAKNTQEYLEAISYSHMACNRGYKRSLNSAELNSVAEIVEKHPHLMHYLGPDREIDAKEGTAFMCAAYKLFGLELTKKSVEKTEESKLAEKALDRIFGPIDIYK